MAWGFNLGETYTGWKGALARLALSRVDVFVVHSRAEIEVYSRWLGLSRDRFEFVPLSVEVSDIFSKPEADDGFILSMGTANRDYKTLFEAVRELPLKVTVVAGKSAVAGLTVPQNVTLLSNLSLEECQELLRAARLVVIPISSETAASGQVTLVEAMMMGKPVIATACSGTEDYIRHGETGMFVDCGDSDGLKSAIAQMSLNQADRIRLANEARLWAQANCTLNAAAEQMRRILHRVSD